MMAYLATAVTEGGGLIAQREFHVRSAVVTSLQHRQDRYGSLQALEKLLNHLIPPTDEDS